MKRATTAALALSALLLISACSACSSSTLSAGSHAADSATTSAATPSDPPTDIAAAPLSPQLPAQAITGVTDTFSCQLLPSISQVLPTIGSLTNESGQKYVFTTAVRGDVSTVGFVVDTDRQLNNYVGRFQLSKYAFKDGDPCYLIAIPFNPSAFANEGTAQIGVGEMKGAVIIDKATVTTVTSTPTSSG